MLFTRQFRALRRSASFFSSATKHSSVSETKSKPVAVAEHSRDPSFDLFNPTDEHRQLRTMLRDFVDKEVEKQASEFNEKEIFNLGLFKKTGELGLLGITANTEFGGSGMDATAALIANEELSSSDPAFCLSYLAHSMLYVNNLNVNGSNLQRSKYLPLACSGDRIGGMCMSESSGGTDVLGMKTTATLSHDKRHYIINGSKMWITNATIDGKTTGDYFLLYAKTGDGPRDISLFIIEGGIEGFSLGQKITGKCGMRASMTGELVLDNCKVPVENLVGKLNGAMICMMRNLEIERLTLAGMSLGIARRCLQVMNDYASERKAFGKSLNEFGQVQRNIAESYAEYMAGRSFAYDVARRLNLQSSGNTLDADGVKLYCATMAKNVADRAIQTLGGFGYVGDFKVERLWRDSKLLEIGGGTNEAHQKNMVRDLRKLVGTKL